MFAAIRERASGAGLRGEQANEFRHIRAQQPGYHGAVEIALEDGRTMIVALWDSEEQQQAASAALQTASNRLGGPGWSGSPPVIARGQVAYDDLTKS